MKTRLLVLRLSRSSSLSDWPWLLSIVVLYQCTSNICKYINIYTHTNYIYVVLHTVLHHYRPLLP